MSRSDLANCPTLGTNLKTTVDAVIKKVTRLLLFLKLSYYVPFTPVCEVVASSTSSSLRLHSLTEGCNAFQVRRKSASGQNAKDEVTNALSLLKRYFAVTA